MRTLIKDFRYGLRMLLKDPGFAAVALLTLALGIGANASIFSVVNAVLLKSLPFREPSRLVLVLEALPQVDLPMLPFSAPDLKIFERDQRSFEGLGAFQNKQFDLSGTGIPERAEGARISSGLFALLGVQPALGRNFRPEEDVPGESVVILSHGLWQRRFGGDPGIIGKTIRLDRHPAVVVGVMPAGFQFPLRGLPFNDRPAELWAPIAFTPTELQAQGSMYNNCVVARLKPEVSTDQARSEALALAASIEEGYSPGLKQALAGAKLGMTVEPLQEVVVGEVRTPLLILLGAVGLVLLIGCANIANLLLARAAARRKEMAIRSALGAGPGRLLRQVLAEGLVLALFGGAAGVLLASQAMDLFVGMIPVSLPQTHRIGIDGSVLLYTLLVSVLTAIVFGLAPGLTASRINLQEALQEGGRSGGASRGRRRLQAAFVVAQFALALVLLAGAGLLLRSFMRLLATDPGFHSQNVLTFTVTLPQTAYPDAARVRGFYDQSIEKLASLPGVKTVAAATTLPLETREVRALQIEGRTQGSGDAPPSIAHVWIQGNYFSALGIPLLRGRLFTATDRQGQMPVVVVSKSMASQSWPGQDPVGRRIRWSDQSPWMTVVGMVGDVKDGPLHTDPRPKSYSPYSQETDEFIAFPVGDLFRALRFVVAGDRDPAAMMPEVRAAIGGLDPELAISDARPMHERLAEISAPQRFSVSLLTVFAGLALLLASVGIYGVMAYSVAQRTHEIGVRMALGARKADIMKLILSQAGTLIAVGMVLGLAGAFAATRVLRSLLYQVTATDPVTFGSVAALLAGVALLASYLPTRRATQVDPLVALRYE